MSVAALTPKRTSNAMVAAMATRQWMKWLLLTAVLVAAALIVRLTVEAQ
jgi:hypothetical protein